jgi:transposase
MPNEIASRPEALPETDQAPFSSHWQFISKAELIQLKSNINFWKAQHQRSVQREEKLKQQVTHLEAQVRDLKQRVFGKKSERGVTSRDKTAADSSQPRGVRGRRKGSQGHGRTKRPHLPVVEEVRDVEQSACCCSQCGLPYNTFPGTEDSEIVEVEVRAYKRLIKRKRYKKSCSCPVTKADPGIITAPVAPKIIPRSPYGNSIWVQALLGKFLYAQPLNRILQDMKGMGLPIAQGTLTGGMQKLIPLFEPVYQALHAQQMSERLFHNDESRWEVFEPVEGKVGHRWYLWVTRSATVIYYKMDPSRSAEIPIAHFKGARCVFVIVVCDRYSAYKKLARLNAAIILAFCWAHVRRDFLELARSHPALNSWGLDWVESIGLLYAYNKKRLALWDPELPLKQQSASLHKAQSALEKQLGKMKQERDRLLDADKEASSTGAQQHRLDCDQRKVLRSLANHWEGLTVFVSYPEVPMDNNSAEQAIRGPVTGRKNYYGSGSIWSAKLTAMLFSIFQTLGLWHINHRRWLINYLDACANNGGKAPADITAFMPWKMDTAQLQQLALPPASKFDTS